MGFRVGNQWKFSLLVAVVLWVAPARANSEYENGDLLATALTALQNEDWVTADHHASEISDDTGRDIITWQRLRLGEGNWSEYVEFLNDHSDWPGLKRLRRAGEGAMPSNLPPATVRAYFADQLPQTGTGALRLAQAFATQGRTADARAEAIRAWTTLSLDPQEESMLLSKYKGMLSRHHGTRLDNLLWDGSTREAERMLPLVSANTAKLARARIGLRRASKNVDALIEDVPNSLKDDAGLAYNRFQWRVKKGRWADAQELLAQRTGSVKSLGRPDKWGSRRRGFARRAMRAGDHDLAYLLASQHSMNSGADYADLEWLSGYISLVHFKAPKQALAHFDNFKSAVKSPISYGRAGYWRGRALEAAGDFDAANIAFGFGSQYQTSFYGQLAAEHLGLPADPGLTGAQNIPDWRNAAFVQSDVLRAGLLLHYADEQNYTRWFFTHIAEELNTVELAQLANLALEIERPFVALGIAKQAAKDGHLLFEPYYPVTELSSYSVDVLPEVAMSIARRESELDPAAVSPAGAQGLMQIMPKTARQVSKELGVEYSKARLVSDWRYNAKLGTAYLGGLLDIYDGSYLLAFAAYNAGPNRVDQWIETYGDPRDSLADQVNWIEHIPYRETRNYVMRVMESLHVYRARINGEIAPLQLRSDLGRG